MSNPQKIFQPIVDTLGLKNDQKPSDTISSSASKMASLAGKTAIITGGSKGIGAATSLALARAGANVVINYSSDDAAANELVSKITSGAQSKVPKAMAVKGDAGDVKAMEAMVNKVVEVYGKIDIVIANAAIMPMADLEHTTEEAYDRVMRTNVKGPLFLAQKAAPHMPPSSSITFLSTSINHASTVMPSYLLYCTSKGAIEQMVHVMSKDLAAKGISVNAVAPGPTSTELFLKGKSEQMIKTIAGFSPHNRLGTPEEIADVLCWITGPGSGWITGQVVRVNGGMC